MTDLELEERHQVNVAVTYERPRSAWVGTMRPACWCGWVGSRYMFGNPSEAADLDDEATSHRVARLRTTGKDG